MLLFFLYILTCSFLASNAAAVPKAALKINGWYRSVLAPRNGNIKLHIALRQEDGGAAVERQLMLAADPGSAGFRQHIGPDKASDLSTPAWGSVRNTEIWLKQHDLLKDASLFGGIFEIDTTIRQAERLLNTTYFVYTDGVQDLVRTELYHLPDSVAGDIDFVAPTTVFPRARAARRPAIQPESRPNIDSQASLQQRDSCGSYDLTSPTCIRQAYGISFEGFNYTVRPDRTRFAVYATEGASYDPEDLQTFLKKYNPPAAQASASYSVIGTGDPQNQGGIGPKFETALDTQTLMGLAWPAKGILYNKGGVFGPKKGVTYDNFVVFLQELISNRTETLPSVVSVSESMPENSLDPGEHKAIFEPEFPASCPFITSVGGTTDLSDEKAATKSTIPVTSRLGYTASGGGFSNVFDRPSYQDNAVANYVNNHIPQTYYSKSGFNSTGRGIPDTSAFSTQFPVFSGPLQFPVGGTSAATPTWAAVITLLNDYEAFHGRPSLGFLNPWLYQIASTGALKDITKGGNNQGSCYFLAGCKLPTTYGYDTTLGWDPVTGLGSPRFQELLRALNQRTDI
ncbi:Tripeptidyl-peptidase sed3 [Pseudocercospora fuligena]|uniref:Tripeptidyl-peptidase sed3 n=1 Tax=Pseudocercospora fuligena TaxID=685502 RepID=A0A8H6RQF9_9PEZI|nr:Tripeptidyl-peptidase sed3 [Pseudocercospora fuligena]